MALVKLLPSSNVLNNTLTLPEVLGKPNESTFTSLYPETKVNSLLKYVEGYPWTVHYYGQIVNTADTLEHIDPSTPSLNQPYYEILDAILQVSSPLTNSYDESTAVTTVNGAALVPFKMIPNVGDMFVAQVDTGEDAVFIINSVYRKTHRKDTLYEVNYTLYQYVSVNPDLLVQIKSKVQDSYHFNKDSQFFNRDALISPMEHKSSLDLSELITETQSFYFDKFFKREVGTILIPGVDSRMYDPYLLMFISKTVDHDSMPPGGISQYTHFERYVKQPVFWDMMLTRSPARANSLNKEISFASSAQLRNQSRYGTVFHAGLDYMACPVIPDKSADIAFQTVKSPDLWERGFLNLTNSFVYEASVKTANNDTDVLKPLLHPLFENDFYVVTSHFYSYLNSHDNFLSVSYMEWLLSRFITRKAISKKDVVVALQSYDSWSALHQLYLLPALWLVAKGLN